MKKLVYLIVIICFTSACAGADYYTRTIPGAPKCGYEKNFDRWNNREVFNHGEKGYKYHRTYKKI